MGDGVEDLFEGGGLVWVEWEWGGFDDFRGGVGVGVAADFFRQQVDPTGFQEGFERGCGVFAEVGDGDRAGGGDEGLDDRVLAWGAAGERGHGGIVRWGGEDRDAAGFCGVLVGADCFWEQGTDHRFDIRSVVVCDPFAGAQEGGGDEGFRVEEGEEWAEVEGVLGGGEGGEDGAGGGFPAEGDADAASWLDWEFRRDGVVEDHFRRAIDEDAGGEAGGLVEAWEVGAGHGAGGSRRLRMCSGNVALSSGWASTRRAMSAKSWRRLRWRRDGSCQS